MAKIQIGTVRVAESPKPPTTTPAPTPTPPAPACLTPEQWLNQHARAKDVVNDYTRRGLCITPTELASKLNIDPNLAETHLEVMRTDKNVVQVATVDGKKVYCSEELIRKILKDLESI